MAGQGVNEMRVFLDGSALEVYLNGQETLSTRLYPTDENSDGLRLFADGAVRILEAQVYRMGSAYEE